MVLFIVGPGHALTLPKDLGVVVLAGDAARGHPPGGVAEESGAPPRQLGEVKLGNVMLRGRDPVLVDFGLVSFHQTARVGL